MNYITFSVQAKSCKFLSILWKRFALTHTELKNGIARQCCISLEKENYNDIRTPLDFRQENDVAATLVPGWKADVENTTL